MALESSMASSLATAGVMPHVAPAVSPVEPAPEPVAREARQSRFTETHRNKQRVQMILSFYRGVKMFRDSFGEGGQRRITYRRMDHLIEAHFRTVKDLSHHLFRDTERRGFTRLQQVTFDMSFGILFHLLLKFKETLRLQEAYDIRRLGAMVDRLTKSPDAELTAMSRLFNALRKDYIRDLAALDAELNRARGMFDELEILFSRIISVYDDNPTILRSLYAHHSFFLKLFPGEGVDRVFRHMFRKTGPADAYITLGFDCLRSGHLEMAHKALARAARYRQKTPGLPPADDPVSALYRKRRMLFIGDNPRTSPEAARRLEGLREFETTYGIEDLLVR